MTFNSISHRSFVAFHSPAYFYEHITITYVFHSAYRGKEAHLFTYLYFQNKPTPLNRNDAILLFHRKLKQTFSKNKSFSNAILQSVVTFYPGLLFGDVIHREHWGVFQL